MKLTKQNIINSLIDYAIRSNVAFGSKFDNQVFFGFGNDEKKVLNSKSFKKIVIESQGKEFYETILADSKKEGINFDLVD